MRLYLSLSLILLLLTSCGGNNSHHSKENQTQNSVMTTAPEPQDPTPVLDPASYEPVSALSGTISSTYEVINSPYRDNDFSVNLILENNPCITDFGTNTRKTFQVTAPMNSIVLDGNFYVGITSYGDVGLLIGNGTKDTTFVAYLCQRSETEPEGMPYLGSMPTIGTTTKCPLRPLVSATLVMPGGKLAAFRMLDYGNSQGTIFPFCN